MLSRIYPQAQDRKTVRRKYRDGKRIKNRDGCQEFKLFLHCSKAGVIESEETKVMLADPNTQILLLFIHTRTHAQTHVLLGLASKWEPLLSLCFFRREKAHYCRE